MTTPTEALKLDKAAQTREMRAFNDWAWRKDGAPIGCMDGQEAGIAAWLARAALAQAEQPAPCHGRRDDYCKCDKRAMLCDAAPKQAEQLAESARPGTWSLYVADMIAAYLKWPVGDPRVDAVAGIIERRKKFDAAPSAAQPQPKGPLDDFGRPIVYDTEAIDSVTHSLTGDEGEDDSVTVLERFAAYVQNVWPGKPALQVLLEYEEKTIAAAQPLTDTRKPCTCDGAGRGPGRACVVKAGGRMGELWRCVEGIGTPAQMGSAGLGTAPQEGGAS